MTRKFGKMSLFLVVLAFSSEVISQQSPKIGRKVGEMHPDFMLPDLDGKLVRLSDFQSKKVLLFNFASW